MPTEDQKKNAERLRRYIQREQLASVMNDTKWRELRALMLEAASFSPRYRVKCLQEPSPPETAWDKDWRYHLPTFKTIEWLDIDPVQSDRKGRLVPAVQVDRTAELEALLGSRSIPFEHEGGFLRVYGYRRKARTPRPER
jgi:hypothetical protein